MSGRLRGSLRLWSVGGVVAVLAVALLVLERSAGPCPGPGGADCIDAVYVGAPGDYDDSGGVAASALLTSNAAGRYDVPPGQQVTVVTRAPLPEGYARFILTRSPKGDSAPVGGERTATPSGTTYTFTVDEDEIGPALVTFALTPARPGPGAEPELGEAVVTTAFRIVSCESGIAVPELDEYPWLVSDCESLLAMREVLAGTGTLDWSAGKPMTEWGGVTVAGARPRVTGLHLAYAGLTGELSGLVGALTQLTELRLEGNALTGMIPSKVARLQNLTHVSLAGNDFSLCVPESLGRVARTDVASLGLPECGPPDDLDSRRTGELLPPGSYRYATAPGARPLVVDIPPGAGIELGHLVIADTFASGAVRSRTYLELRDQETGSRICLDPAEGERCPSPTVETPRVGAIFDRIAESLWRAEQGEFD